MSKKKKISVSVARRSISEEKYTIFKDGKFNPDCPDSFKDESTAVKRIVQIQRTRWEHRLAQQLLKEKLLDLDNELYAISE